MIDLGEMVRAAMLRARAAGYPVHHVTLTPAAMDEAGLPRADYRYGKNASQCVVWARDGAENRLIPYPVEGT